MQQASQPHSWPPGWKPKKIRQISSLKGRLGWQGLKAHEYLTAGPHVVSSAHFRKERIAWEMCPRVSPRRYELDYNIQLRVDDVLLMKDGAAMGKLAYVDWLPGEACLNSHLLLFRPHRNAYVPKYLFYVLDHPHFRGYSKVHGTGVTFAGLSQKLTGEYVVHLPPLPEQRRIAEILDTLDEAIRRTEEVIAKLQQMKQGLLHDLLTRGIDEHGELRDPERDPEQFKDSPPGRIPRGWEVERVEDLLADVDPAMRSGPFGSALLKDELVSKGVPLLGIDNVHVEQFVREFGRFVTPQKAVELSRYRVRPRDVMITIMGTVGRCALVPDDLGEALSSKHVWTLTFDQTRYSPYLACLQFNHAPWVLAHFSRDVQGGIMSAIRSDTLRTALLPVPPPAEQHRVASVLADLDRRLAGESVDADKLRTLKHGLMDDLLTGRVRATVPQEAAP